MSCCNSNVYPCNYPVSLAYVFPRAEIDVKLCTYHPPLQNRITRKIKSIEELEYIYNNHQELIERRNKFLEQDFKGAGCDEGCVFYNAFKVTNHGYEINSHQKKREIETIWLSIGPDCNLRCRYCLEPEDNFVDFNTCDPSILELAYDFVMRGGHLILTGGEPFLPKWGLVNYLKQFSVAENVKGKIDIHTNGTFLDKKTIDLILQSPFDKFGVSMDTYKPALFNYIRRGASFEHVLRNVLNLKNENEIKFGKNSPVSIVILCAVTKTTAKHLYDTVDFFVNIDLNISLNAIFECGFSPKYCQSEGLHNLSCSEMAKLYETVQKIGSDFGDKVNWAGFKGQVQHMLKQKLDGVDSQVKLAQGK